MVAALKVDEPDIDDEHDDPVPARETTSSIPPPPRRRVVRQGIFPIVSAAIVAGKIALGKSRQKRQYICHKRERADDDRNSHALVLVVGPYCTWPTRPPPMQTIPMTVIPTADMKSPEIHRAATAPTSKITSSIATCLTVINRYTSPLSSFA